MQGGNAATGMAPAESAVSLPSELELAKRAACFDALLEALPNLYFRLDAAGRIVAWHAGRESATSLSAEACLGRLLADVLPVHVAAAIAAAALRSRRGREVVTIHYSLPSASGEDAFEARLAPSGDDETMALIRRAPVVQGGEASSPFADERRRGPVKLEVLGPIAARIAHDFNNFLTVVLGRLEFLRRAPGLGDADRNHVSEALDAATQAASLTRRLMTFSRERSPPR